MAAAVAVLLLGPALADYVQWSLWRQGLQRQADDGALAGARAIRDGNPPEPAVRARLRGRAFADPPRIEHPPRSGAFAGRATAVRLSLTAVRSPFFHSRLFGASRMRANATAAVLAYRDGGAKAVRVE